MSSTIQTTGDHGVTLYAQVVRASDAEYWNGTAFAAYATANIATYAITLAEVGTASGFYDAAFPSGIAAGDYGIVVRQKVGGSVAETDPVVASGPFSWDGTAPVGDQSINAKTKNLPSDPAGLAALASAHGTGSWLAVSVTVDAVTNQLIVTSGWGQISAFAGADLILTVLFKDGAGAPIDVSAQTFALYGANRPDHSTTWSVTAGGNFDMTSAATGTVKVTIDRLTTEHFGGTTHDVDIWRTDATLDETVKAWGQVAWMTPARPPT